MLDQIERRRLRRELIIARAGYGLGNDEIAAEIISMPFKKRENRRLDFKPISRHSISDLIDGTRDTRKTTLETLSHYISRKRNLPEFIFNISRELVTMAQESQKFFRAPGVPSELPRKYEGYYLSISKTKHLKVSALVDYDNTLKIHFARAKISYMFKDGEFTDVYGQGFAILKPNTFTIFLRDSWRYDPYILEFPQVKYSLAESENFQIDYFGKELKMQASMKIPNNITAVRRPTVPQTAQYEFMGIVEFWNPDRSQNHAKYMMNRYYDIFGSNPMFYVNETTVPIVDRLFEANDVQRTYFKDPIFLLKYI